MGSSIQISNDQVVEAVARPERSRAEDLAKTDLWIFREGRRAFSGRSFLLELQRHLGAKNSLLDSLIQAGELEAALADTNDRNAAICARLTDSLAFELYCETCGVRALRPNDAEDPAKLAAQIDPPESISISPPEGFSYYALHPLDFARAVEEKLPAAPAYAVIGIRSIGTTLSAATMAALHARGRVSSRITVRPTGHPYDRSTQLSPEQRSWIAKQLSAAAHFLVVDEGPGRSGSTFLSVAEALCRVGVPIEQITIIGSRPFVPNQLCAADSTERWRQFRFTSVQSSTSHRFNNWTYMGGGDWRKIFFDSEREWPESWTQMERFKALSPDGAKFAKFEGMGRLGEEAKQRALALANERFSPRLEDLGDGFLSYDRIYGTHLRARDLTPTLLEHIARYCAFRSREFRSPGTGNSELEHMLTFNVQEEFGRELKLHAGQLSAEYSVIADGRMQPYEWIATESGAFVKTDAISHGDNHFFPGSCSIAWDLAGAIIEWDLGENATEFLLSKFQQLSGFDPSANLPLYLLAYCIFRLGFCKMARVTVLGTNEERRLDFAYQHYRNLTSKLLESYPISA